MLGRGRYASPLMVCANDEQVLSYKAGDNSDNHTTISDSALAARNTCNTEDSLSEESANDFDSSHWKYLYEPNASIMKAGCFDVLEQRFAVHHISPNSHLFVAAEPIADFSRQVIRHRIHRHHEQERTETAIGRPHARQHRRTQFPPNRGPAAQKNSNSRTVVAPTSSPPPTPKAVT